MPTMPSGTASKPRPAYDPTNPLIVQSDRSVLVEVDNPRYAAARDALAPFAELEKSPEHVHTYRLTALSLWNAAGLVDDAHAAAAEHPLDRVARHRNCCGITLRHCDHRPRA